MGQKFPGCQRLFGLALEKDNVTSLRVAEELFYRDFHQLGRAIESKIEAEGKPDFAFIIYRRQQPGSMENAYDCAKAALTKHGVPSQFVSWDLIDSQHQFSWSIANIALSFFTKLGGKPWTIAIDKVFPGLVVGIGRIETFVPKSQTKRRVTGFATCVLSNGTYQGSKFFAPAATYEEFLDSLRSGVADVLDSALSQKQQLSKITVHISQFERRDTVRIISETLRPYERKLEISLPIEVVRLSPDSEFAVLDLEHPGYVAEEGTVVALSDSHALLVTEGRKSQRRWYIDPVTPEWN